MSKPKNHHFVSQVHIKNFFNTTDRKIYVYDKILNNLYYKDTTKSLFSEKDLNTKLNNGIKDFESLEKDLNDFFENDFASHYLTIKKFIEKPDYSEKVNHALFYFAKYGAIGEIRNPREKQSIEDALFEVFSEISKNATQELKNEIQKSFTYKKESKYLNSIQYSKFAEEILDSMGDLIFRIEIPRERSDCFLLPDFCAANSRQRINEYFNPDAKDIAYIGLPLSSKIYIHYYSTKIRNIKAKSGKILVDSNRVFELNKVNLEYCKSKVACESKEYLNEFIKNLAQQRV